MNATPELLTPDRCCLLVVDPQERLMAALHKSGRIVRAGVLLIHCARELAIPILATTQYKKGLGPLVPELESLLGDVPTVDKVEFNALANPEVRDLFAELPSQRDTVLLLGAEAHICIFQTAVGVLRAGRQPWVVADGVSCRNKRHVEPALNRLRDLGAIVGPAEMAVYELLRQAGGPAFKAMLPHLK